MNSLKRTAAALMIVVAATGVARAQSLEENRDKKLGSPFLSKAAWVTDYDKALDQAKRQKKLIFAYFTRSYEPCPPCLQLEGGALLTDEFSKFAEKYVVFCHITTQIEGEKHGDLLEKKGGQGFPHLVFMDAAGSVLAEHEGERDAAGFTATGRKASAFVDLKAKAEKGDPAAKVDFLIARLELGQLDPTDAEKELKAAGKLTKAQQDKVDGLLADAAIAQTLKGLGSEEAAKAAGKTFLARHKEGKRAPTSEQLLQPYWVLLLRAAEEAKDAASFEAGLMALKAKFGELPQARKFFDAQEETLKNLKAAPPR